MTTHDFNNSATQKEKRETLHKDTFFNRAQSDLDEAGGRFAKQSKATIIGSGPVSYPTQPIDSPWGSDPVPPEEPLGYSIDDLGLEGSGDVIGEAPTASPSVVEPGGEAVSKLGGAVSPNFRRRV